MGFNENFSDVSFENLLQLNNDTNKGEKFISELKIRRENHEKERQIAKSKVEPKKAPIQFK